MKTYYFSQRWEDEWECGDGCCSGGGEWVINFLEMVDENGNTWDSNHIGTSWTVEDALRQVWELEYDVDVPDYVLEKDYDWQYSWYVRQLYLKDVSVVFKNEGKY